MKRKILLLCSELARKTGTVADHIRAFEDFSAETIYAFDSGFASRQDIDLNHFDVIVLHYSIVISHATYLSKQFSERLAEYGGLKVLFIQDEFRWVDRTMKTIEKLGISVVFTVVNDVVVRQIYREPYFDHVRFEYTLTGFVPEHLIDVGVPPYQDREKDVVYRARKLPGWCGSFALQKWQIGERFLADAPAYGLKCDIAMSEASRIYGDRWTRFIAHSKATLGTESGTSFVDFTGDVYKKVEAYEAANPSATFDEIRDKFLEGRDGEIVIHVISPRCFEAACLRTLMVMYPGDFSGVLQAGRHYVELERDHSNMAEVVEVLRNPDRAGEIIENAYEEIAKAPTWTFRSFIAHFDRVVDEELSKRQSVTADAASATEVRASAQGSADDAAGSYLDGLIEAHEAAVRLIHRKAGIIAAALQVQRAIVNGITLLPRGLREPTLDAFYRAQNTIKPLARRALLGSSD